MKTSLIFDLDGTLVDSAPDLHSAACHIAELEGMRPHSLAQTKSFIGNGVPKLVERVIRHHGLPMEKHAVLLDAFLAHYDAHMADLTRPYPQVVETLEQLAGDGHRLGVCTNKPAAPAKALLATLGLERFFEVIVGGDQFPNKKPDPEGLLFAFSGLGEGPQMFVGDSEVDADTAVAAGVPFALFSQGYRKSPVQEIAHDFAFESFGQLPAMVRGFG